MAWTTVADLMPSGATEEWADQRLASAWSSILHGKGSREDGELVVADLATRSGYFTVAPANITANELFMREGARTIFARIFFLLDVSMQQAGDLSVATLRQQVKDEED